MTSRILMSRRIRCLLAWRCDLWCTIVCLRLPFWFLSVSRLSLCFLSLSFSSSFCLFLTLYVSVSFSLSLVSVSSLLTHSVSSSPSLYLSLCLHLRLSSRSLLLCPNVRLFISTSVSLSLSLRLPPSCLISPIVSLRISQISTLCIRSPIFTIGHFALIRRYIIILNLFPLHRIVLEIGLYIVYAGIHDFPQ